MFIPSFAHSPDQFRELNTEHAVLLFPAFRVQQQLRRNVFGKGL